MLNDNKYPIDKSGKYTVEGIVLKRIVSKNGKAPETFFPIQGFLASNFGTG
jgi:hypothetical protein